jgi:hypothetical protein
MVFEVSFEIIIQRAVGNESCYPMKKHFNNCSIIQREYQKNIMHLLRSGMRINQECTKWLMKQT